MRFNSLDAWLEWQATLNPAEINLGLERIESVLERMGLTDRFDCPLIMVAGTNGKGSVVAMLEAIALAEGLEVGCYTSPHIRRYNERIRVNAIEVSDESLCGSFERIDEARGDCQLTYFEFGTLAAIDLFHKDKLDLVIMEIGLGGRLDAVNVMQPDVSVVTTVDIDHTDWLGSNREAIGYEKAGIFRADAPAVCGDKNPPLTLIHTAQDLKTKCFMNGKDFFVEKHENHWRFKSELSVVDQLPWPSLEGDIQLENAAVSLMAVQLLDNKLNINESSIKRGLSDIKLEGRYQIIRQNPDVIIDVAHNVQAAESLSNQLGKTKSQYNQTHAVIAMLADKEVQAVIEQLLPNIDVWHCAGLESVPRGLSAKRMASTLEQVNTGVKLRAESTVNQACASAIQEANVDDRIIVLGSFYTVSEAMSYFGC